MRAKNRIEIEYEHEHEHEYEYRDAEYEYENVREQDTAPKSPAHRQLSVALLHSDRISYSYSVKRYSYSKNTQLTWWRCDRDPFSDDLRAKNRTEIEFEYEYRDAEYQYEKAYAFEKNLLAMAIKKVMVCRSIVTP